MPAVIGRPPKPAPFRSVPSRVALAVEPELNRRVIPARVTLDANAPPYAGELREEQTGPKVTIAPGQLVVLASLRRPWNFVGFTVDVGTAGVVGLTAILRTRGRGLNGFVVNQGLPFALPAAGVVSLVGFVIGEACDLLVANGIAPPAPAPGVRGAIWGMGEK